MSLIISVSGLRGIVGDSLTPEVAVRYAAAFVASLPPGEVLVGRDGRATGTMIAGAVAAAVTASGRDCVDLGVIATPTIGHLVKTTGAAGAIQITASHNPPPYNGIKLFGGDGRVINAVAGASVGAAYANAATAYVAHDKIGSVTRHDDPHAGHIDAVLATVDRQRIVDRQFNVLIDANHGSGAVAGVPLLRALGCDVTAIGERPDGGFVHPPEPIAENLTDIGEFVVQHRCDVGFCQDPDADRLAIIDENGRFIGEEATVALCVQRKLLQLGDDAAGRVIVINGATSSMTETLAEAAGATVVRSAVGEANVADAMLAASALYGGEGNGGPIDPAVGLIRDSYVGMAAVLDLMARTGVQISQLADALPRRALIKRKVDLPGGSSTDLSAIFDAAGAAMPGAAADRSDGLRLAWPDRWLLIRGSNTEPIARLIAEAETTEQAELLCDRAETLFVAASCRDADRA